MKYTSNILFVMLLSSGFSVNAQESHWTAGWNAPSTHHPDSKTSRGTDTIEMLFASGSSTLSDAAVAVLRPFISRVKFSPSTILTLTGYSDARGSKNDNLVLSMKRARTVRDFLIEHGIRPTNIRIVAHGENRAAVNIQQIAELVQDRRVVITTSASISPTKVKSVMPKYAFGGGY